MRPKKATPPKTKPAAGPLFPMRINKFLAHNGYTTRKGADELIAKKLVRINGRAAVLGDKVTEQDLVEIEGGGAMKKYSYFAYNKPVGVITHSPQRGEKDIKAAVGRSDGLGDVFPVGRLDKDSHGLIILTNDGRITDKLLNPDFAHDKEYKVRTKLRLRDSFKKNMEGGLDIDGYVTKKCKVDIRDEQLFHITLNEGKKHQIRRMVAALHNAVDDLERVRILNIKLGNLAPGLYRRIEGEELKEFLAQLNLK